MTDASIASRRKALQAEIAASRATLAERSHEMRGAIGTALLGLAIARVLPRRFRWLGLAAAAVIALRGLRDKN